MKELAEIINRIRQIATLSFQEAIRRKLILFLVICCVLFVGSGAGCANACMGLTNKGMGVQRAEQVRRIRQLQIPDEKKSELIAKLDRRVLAGKKQGQTALKTALYTIIFSMIAFWLFLIAGLFTPFLSLNDFLQRTHVMLLSGPTARWEYLAGKYLALLGLSLMNLLILVMSAYFFIYLSIGKVEWELLQGVAIFAHGLTVFAAMAIFLSLAAGRMPAIFLCIVITALGIFPGIALASGKLDYDGSLTSILSLALAYGLPQYGVNYFHALSQIVKEADTLSGMSKIGNHSGAYSLFINTGWFVVFWVLSIVIINRRELET